MSVLVGIVSKNRAAILPKAIESALSQQCEGVTVAVIDDHSSDDTPLLQKKFPLVKWERLSETNGYVFARNKLMKEARSEYFCSLDDDAWFIGADSLSQAVKYLESNPSVAAIAFDILSPDRPDINPRSHPYYTGMFIGCGHLLKLSAVKEVGYYDPNPSFYGAEEKDLIVKLINKDYQIVFMPGVHIWHDKTNIARDQEAQHLSGVCNDLVFMYRRAPLVFLIPGLIFKIIKHIRFSLLYNKGYLLKAGIFGILKFLGLFFSFKLRRSPVAVKAFKKYHALNQQQTRAI